MEKEFYTIKDFAALVGVHPNTIRRQVKSGRIKAFKICPGEKVTYRISRSEIGRINLIDMEEMIEKIIDNKQLKK